MTDHERWWQVPRRSPRRLVAGVAAGTADELGVDRVLVRTIFVVLTVAGGWGVVLYVVLWIWSSLAAHDDPATSRPKGRSDRHRHLALLCATLGALLLIRGLGLGFTDSLVWPSAALGLGFAALWQRSGDDVDLMAAISGAEGSRYLGVRVAAGIAVAAGGVTALLALNFDFGAARNVALGSLVVLAGLGLVLGPWIMRTVNDLAQERHRRIRSEERTEVAAHLHDSVLQTLALIQRNSDDRNAMVQLARKQERELRDWLYGGGGDGPSSVRRATVELAAEVEELHGLPVDAVVVGDLELDGSPDVAALLGAVREALVNAAKHSGAEKVDLFTEVLEDRIDVFVRDTGVGFDLAEVGDDRRGLAESIRGRMERAGGSCAIVTSPGEGTEVELSIPRPPEVDA